MWKKRVYFFYHFLITQGILKWPPGGTSLGTSTWPHPSPGVRIRAERRLSPKNPSVFSAHAPSWIFLGYHKDEHSGSSSYIRALRSRGLGLTDPPQGSPMRSLLDHVITPWRHHLFDIRLTSQFVWQVTWPLAERWLVHLFHVTYIRLSDWSSPGWPPLLLACKFYLSISSTPLHSRDFIFFLLLCLSLLITAELFIQSCK